MEHQKIQEQVKKIWDKKQLNKTDLQKGVENPENKKYILDMFPYPSGEGLHVGHLSGYILSDLLVKIEKMERKEVLHPMGFDSFGLPAENHAIKIGTHPKRATKESKEYFKQQLDNVGTWYDWDYELSTHEPEYYKWTQRLFLQLYKRGLAYKSKAPVNWCPSCETVLANEQVKDGECERCDSQVEKKELSQWFFKTTEYAEELYNDIDELNWPEKVKLMQKNWIGKSVGSQFQMSLRTENGEKIKDFQVYTTRLDTVFGMTYVVFSAEKTLELIKEGKLDSSNKADLKDYSEKSIQNSEIERESLTKEKTGVKFEGVYSINPFTGEKIQVRVADFVIGSYGTGVVMSVPAHDERDWEFAHKFDIPVRSVIKPKKKICFITYYENLVNQKQALKEADKNQLFYKITSLNDFEGVFLLGWVDSEDLNYLENWTNNYIKGSSYRSTQLKEGKEKVPEPFNTILGNEKFFEFQENTAYTKKGIVDIKDI